VPTTDERIAVALANRFAASTGMEFEDLYQEAMRACWTARTDGSYDPRKASLNTYQTTCAYRHLCTVAVQHKRSVVATVEISMLIQDCQPSPEEIALFRDMVGKLPDDARLVVDMIFNQLGSVTGMTHIRVRQFLRLVLPWSPSRIDRAFRDIRLMLRG
jgi:DNA-directed RNA polymerase specialized sigma24 family protein